MPVFVQRDDSLPICDEYKIPSTEPTQCKPATQFATRFLQNDTIASRLHRAPLRIACSVT